MSGEVISLLSLEGRYYNCHDERAQRARDNYEIVTKSPNKGSQALGSRLYRHESDTYIR